MLLGEELDRSFGNGPVHRPIEERLAAGRRAVRRRRVAGAAGGLAVVAVLGGTFAAAGLGGEQRGTDVVDTPPTSTADPNDGPVLWGGQLATLNNGELVVRDGARVLRRVENPLRLEPPERSLGLVVEYRGKTTWMMLDWTTDGGNASSSSVHEPAGRTFSTFDLWLASAVAAQLGDPTLSLVRFAEGETLAPVDGVELLDQRSGIDLGPEFAEPGAHTAVAMVRWEGDIWFVLARESEYYRPEYLPTQAFVADGATTIDEFLDWAATEYRSAESPLPPAEQQERGDEGSR